MDQATVAAPRAAAAPINRAMTATEWGLLLGMSVLWGGSFFFAGVALDALPPFTIVVLRVGLAALMLGATLRVLGLGMPHERLVWRAFFGMGLLNNVVPFCLIVWSQTHIASGLAAILGATTPFATVIVAHLLTADEKLTRLRVAGVLAGLAGVVVMIGPDALAGLGANVLAQLAVLGAAVSYAFAGVYGRRFKTLGASPIQTAAGQVTASAAILLPVALLVDQPWTLAMPGFRVWGAVFGIAALSTALGYVVYFRILATAGATNVLLVTFLNPVTAILLGTLVLGERLAPRHGLGMALIGLGLAAIDGRLFAAGQRRRGDLRTG